MRKFIIVWLGQIISFIGSDLTSFAVGIWIYQKTGSVTQLSLISLFILLPGIIVAPVAGALVDRWNRRVCMILSDCGAMSCSIAIVSLITSGRLEIWHIYLAITLSSVFNTFGNLAYTANISLLVPKQHLGRASGMVQVADAVAQLVSPLLAGVLLAGVGLRGIIILDGITFIVSITALLSVRFPKAPITETVNRPLLQQVVYGWNYIVRRKGLLALLIFFATSNFVVGIAEILVKPLVLSFTNAAALGTLLSLASSGLMLGSILMSVWGGPKQNRILGVLGFEAILGFCLIVIGLKPSITQITAAGFVGFFSVPMINGCSQAIWQVKVAPDVQGRVFAVRRALTLASRPLAYLVAGALADKVFEPLMSKNGVLAKTIGLIIGVGKGRGIALLFIITGVLTITSTFIAYQYPRLRQLEKELPDVI